MSIFEILRKIESNSSRNQKKSILLENASNHELKQFLLYALNPRWIYGVGPKTIKPYDKLKETVQTAAPTQNALHQRSLFGSTATNTSTGYKSIYELCDDLKLHPFGSNQDVRNINNFLANCTEEEYYWYNRLLRKDLKMGCSASTINEVLGDFIPEFDVMLAHPYKDHANKVVGLFQLQKKLDGFRFLVFIRKDGNIQFFTRNGVELFDFPEIERDIKSIPLLYSDIVLDGELQANDSFNDTQKLVMRDGDKVGLTYFVFDTITIEEFEAKQSQNVLFYRYDWLSSVFKEGFSHGSIQLVPELYRGSDLNEITKWFEHAKANKWEGIMIKMNTPYVRKRTTNMLKVKEMDTIDLRVIKVNPGTGKHEGRLGSVTVLLEDVEVDVGSGFDDYSRQQYWDNPNLIVDHVIEIQYFEKTINESGKPSLRFPVFKCIRKDK